MRRNKIAPLQHLCLASLGTCAKGVQFYCPSCTYSAIPYFIALFFHFLAHCAAAEIIWWSAFFTQNPFHTKLSDVHQNAFWIVQKRKWDFARACHSSLTGWVVWISFFLKVFFVNTNYMLSKIISEKKYLLKILF